MIQSLSMRQALYKVMGPTLVRHCVSSSVMVAGGAINDSLAGRKPNDIDCYFHSVEDAHLFIQNILSMGYQCMGLSPRSLYFVYRENSQPDVNVILWKYFHCLDDVISLFDFTCCKAGYCYHSEVMHSHPRWGMDNISKLLVYEGSQYPLGALFRIQKYVQRGYTIDKTSMLTMYADLHALHLETREDVADQVGAIYGLDLDAMWPADEPFTFADFLMRLQLGQAVFIERKDFVDNDKVFDHPQLQGVFRWGYIEHGDAVWYTALDKYGTPIRLHKHPSEAEKDNAEELTFPMFFYKRVTHVEEDAPHIFSAPYQQNFKYLSGRYVVAEHKNYGLFCYPYSDGIDEPGEYICTLRCNRKEDIKRTGGAFQLYRGCVTDITHSPRMGKSFEDPF